MTVFFWDARTYDGGIKHGCALTAMRRSKGTTPSTHTAGVRVDKQVEQSLLAVAAAINEISGRLTAQDFLLQQAYAR
jgi:hypothetical protein